MIDRRVPPETRLSIMVCRQRQQLLAAAAAAWGCTVRLLGWVTAPGMAPGIPGAVVGSMEL